MSCESKERVVDCIQVTVMWVCWVFCDYVHFASSGWLLSSGSKTHHCESVRHCVTLCFNPVEKTAAVTTAKQDTQKEQWTKEPTEGAEGMQGY